MIRLRTWLTLSPLLHCYLKLKTCPAPPWLLYGSDRLWHNSFLSVYRSKALGVECVPSYAQVSLIKGPLGNIQILHHKIGLWILKVTGQGTSAKFLIARICSCLVISLGDAEALNLLLLSLCLLIILTTCLSLRYLTVKQASFPNRSSYNSTLHHWILLDCHLLLAQQQTVLVVI